MILPNGWHRVGLNVGTDLGAGIRRTATQTVLIETDGAPLTRQEIEAHYECPQPWQEHPLDPLVWCKKMDLRDDPMNSIKTVVFEYDNEYNNDGKMPAGGPRKFEPNPLLRPAEITRDTWVQQEEVVFDMDDKRVETTAKERMIFQADFRYLQFNVVKHIPSRFRFPQNRLPDQNNIEGMGHSPGRDSVDFLNSDNLILFGETYEAGTLWATDFRESSYNAQDNYIFYTFAFKIRVNPNGWKKWMLNAGWLETRRYIQWGRASTTPVWIEDFTGLPLASIPRTIPGEGPALKEKFEGQRRIQIGPDKLFARQEVLLDENGRAYRDSEGFVIAPDTGGGSEATPALYKKFRLYQKLDFAKNLPLSLEFNGKA